MRQRAALRMFRIAEQRGRGSMRVGETLGVPRSEAVAAHLLA